jgi:hypothetical protein
VNDYVLVFGVTVYSALVLYAGCSLLKTRDALDAKIAELDAERQRLKETEEQALALVDKVTPLIEKTDWMTGRWSGQFDTLVRLENKRNTKVDTARRALWEIPIVRDHIERITNNGENK